MLKKIKFYTLERFNLTDANELQSGVLDKIKALTGLFKDNTAASDLQSGPIEAPTIQNYATAGVPNFGPLKVITSKNDVIELTQTDVDNGFAQVTNFPAVYADFLTLHAGGETPDAIYFYAYPIYEDSDVESRDFYSIIDDAVVNQSVATRNRARLNLFASNDASYLVEVGGEKPIYLGYVPKGKLRGPTNDAGSTTVNSATPFLPSHFKPYTHFGKAFDAAGNYNDEDGGITNEDNGRHLTVEQNLQNIEPGNRGPLRLVFDKIKRNFDRIKSFGEDDPVDTDLLGPNERPKYSLQGLKKIIENEVATLNSTISDNQTETLTEVRLYYAVKKTGTQTYQVSKWTDPTVVAYALYNNYEKYAASIGAVHNTAINDMSNPVDQHATLRHLVISLPPAFVTKYIAGLNVNMIVNSFDVTDPLFGAAYDFDGFENSVNYVRRLKDLDFQSNLATTKPLVSKPGSVDVTLVDHTTLTVDAGIEILLMPREIFSVAATFDVVFEIKLILKEYV
jgi:hypothetical protein